MRTAVAVARVVCAYDVWHRSHLTARVLQPDTTKISARLGGVREHRQPEAVEGFQRPVHAHVGLRRLAPQQRGKRVAADDRLDKLGGVRRQRVEFARNVLANGCGMLLREIERFLSSSSVNCILMLQCTLTPLRSYCVSC